MRLQDDKNIDYSIIYDVLWYLQNHSETIHHPKENIVYQYYVEHYGENSDMLNLIEEHDKLTEDTQIFADLVETVMQDSVVPYDIFTHNLRLFIEEQKHHLDIEEKHIIPLLLRDFTQKDWDAVEVLWGDDYLDPLFGNHVQREYLNLAKRLAEV